jgi:hypothetical protein
VKINKAVLKVKSYQISKKMLKKIEKLSFGSAVHLTPSELLGNLKAHIVKKAIETASAKIRKRPNWFSGAKYTLIDLIETRNQAFKALESNHLRKITKNFQEAKHLLLNEKRKAKRQ